MDEPAMDDVVQVDESTSSRSGTEVEITNGRRTRTSTRSRSA